MEALVGDVDVRLNQRCDHIPLRRQALRLDPRAQPDPKIHLVIKIVEEKLFSILTICC